AAMSYVLPAENNRPAIPRLPETADALVDHATRPQLSFRRLVPGRINQDALDPAEVVMLDGQEQEAGLRGDRDLHLIGDRQPTAPLPSLLGDEHPQVVAQFGLLGFIEQVIQGHVALNVGQPVRWEWRGEQPPPAPPPKPR